jgi:predicted dithiol-disulfide oxidoreductase (DUF899 family)
VGRVARSGREAPGLKRRMGWTFPWVSSHGSDFNFDFNVSSARSSSGRETSNTTTGPVPILESRSPGLTEFAAMTGADVRPIRESRRA